MSFLSELLGGDPAGTVVKEYRETQYRDDYRIKFVSRSGGYKIYAVSFPRDPHEKGPDVHHKYEDGHLCVTSTLPTLAKAKAVAIHWMTGWSAYIRSSNGRWPRNGNVRVNVPD